MASRDRRHDDLVSPEDDRRTRRKRDSPSDSDRDDLRDRRKSRDHAGDRRARHHDRRRDYEDPDDEGRARHRRHRRDRSLSESLRRDDDKDDGYRERRHRHRSRSGDRSRQRRRSRSPPAKKRRKSLSISPSPPRRSRAPLSSQVESFRSGPGAPGAAAGDAPPPEKQKPNFKPTGLLAKEANTVAGTTTVLKYHEPPEARKPPAKEAWRLYVFKKKDLLDTIYLHQRSCWLVGRDQKVTDLLLEHPSISKQHAVVQFRYITSTNEYGDRSSKVKPYLIDLESANGTKLNGEKVEASRYVELVDGDVVAFGDSEREYVVMLPPAV